MVVHTDTAGRVAADAAVVTAPLGALKRGVPAFSPPLPPGKQAAIERLGFGLLNKVSVRTGRGGVRADWRGGRRRTGGWARPDWTW